MADNKNQKKQPIYETPEQLYQRALAVMERDPLIVKHSFRAENYRRAAGLFHLIPDYEDSAQQEKTCLELAALADEKELEFQYNRALELKKGASSEKGCEKAIAQFQTVSGYRDADAQIAECEQKYASISRSSRIRKSTILVILLAVICSAVWFFQSPTWNRLWLYITTGSTSADTSKSSSSGNTIPALSASAAEGDVISFGPYAWYVLTREEDRVQLLINHAEKYDEFRHLPYNEEDTDITWADSSLRAWLNGAFLQDHFSEEEQAQILTVHTPALDNPVYGTDAGEDTEDKVTLLTPQEVTDHMDLVKGIRMNIWLRTPGNAADTAMFMSARNALMDYGYPVSTTDFYTCPVIWVSLEESAPEEQ